MSKRVPVARQISWLMVIPQIVVITVLMCGVGFLLYDQLGYIGFAGGAVLYLLWSFGSRAWIARFQRQGMKLVRQGDFRSAIAKFEQSYAFFSRHVWLDRYRAVTLLTPSAASYREIALVNTAFCYSQLGDGQQAKVYYERALAEFPNSSVAEAALNFIHSVEKRDAE